MRIKQLISFTICNLITSSAILAQEAEPALAKVHYIFKHVNDTTQRDKYLRDEVVTYLGKTSAYYTSYSNQRVQDDLKKQLDDPTFDGVVNLTKSTSRIEQSYLYDLQKQELTEVTLVGSDELLTPGVYPDLEWTITEESKTIGGYVCQKAQVSFKGRDYTAWFTTELPFSSGPWKLHGLPGLILEARDAKNEVQFEYSGFEKMDEGVFPISASANAIESTAPEVAKLQKAYKANPQAYLQAKQSSRRISTANASSGSGGGGTITVTGSRSTSGGANSGIDASKIKSMTVRAAEGYDPSRTTNNPLELTP